ncbi:MAG: amino acid ABC transporter permease [Anaerolineae bacterium]|nr:amino acid ABC transporter permease [Anaerolineae bacterium]
MLSQIPTYILSGMAITIAVTLVALPMGFVLGLTFALLRVYGGKFLSAIMAAYSTIMRGVPPLVLLFVLYFIISGVINLTPFWAGSLALGVVSSGYQLEIIRGALCSVGSTQMTAARAIGMSRAKAVRYIILPQALRLIIPSWSNEASVVLKDSSLVSALGVAEITRKSQLIGASTYKFLLAFLTAALIYFILVFLTNRLLDYVERKTRIPGFSHHSTL